MKRPSSTITEFVLGKSIAALGQLFALKKTIYKNRGTITSVTSLFSSNIASSVLGAIGGLMVARFLGPEETGAFRVYTIPLTYLIFLHLGTWDGIWRQIPYYIGKDMPEQIDRLASVAGAFNLLVSSVVSFGFICLSVYSFFYLHDLYAVFGWLSQAMLCWRVFYGGSLISTYQTLNNFVKLARIQITQTMIAFCMVFLLPFIGFYGLCARSALPAIVAIWLFHRNRPLKIRYRFDVKSLKELFRIGFPFSFWGNLETSIWLATESALVLSFGGVTCLGLFSVAVVLRSAVNTLPISILQVLTPRIVTEMARDESVRNANARIIGLTLWLTGFMMIVVYIGAILLEKFVPQLIPMYIDGLSVMKVCLWFSVVQAAFLPINNLFAKGKPWIYGRSVLLGLIVFPIATYFIEPMVGGLLAVAMGSLLGRTARTLAAYVDLFALARQERP